MSQAADGWLTGATVGERWALFRSDVAVWMRGKVPAGCMDDEWHFTRFGWKAFEAGRPTRRERKQALKQLGILR